MVFILKVFDPLANEPKDGRGNVSESVSQCGNRVATMASRVTLYGATAILPPTDRRHACSATCSQSYRFSWPGTLWAFQSSPSYRQCWYCGDIVYSPNLYE